MSLWCLPTEYEHSLERLIVYGQKHVSDSLIQSILKILADRNLGATARAANMYNLGVSFEARGRYATAVQFYKQAYALDGKREYRSAVDRIAEAQGDN